MEAGVPAMPLIAMFMKAEMEAAHWTWKEAGYFLVKKIEIEQTYHV